ncbi:hypothetical protein [Parvicella tangerina]|uniref:Tetratricopeptide repeat protein n=1 Tax=Parvicella tangerina TaxID=2829795 RepID=A0A916JMF0_9FLAO|nr:hypothetical protein [Parvicella tangerina]CAG5080607.1 hypothetical protein CRYO30217_01393 [Parvicella tangerina]
MKKYVDYIKDIIISLHDDDVKEFRTFIQRQRSKKERKDLQLFNILLKDENLKAREICTLLYGHSKNMNAYHSVRKRLLKQLMEFLVLKRMDDDTTAASYIMGLISVSHFLFESSQGETAWHYLLKAEELALKNEQYDLLDNIYNLQVTHANHNSAPAIDLIIQNWKKNKQLADEDERANVAKMIIKHNLERKIKEEMALDLHSEIERVLDEYQLETVVFNRPKLLYNFLTIIRSAALASKDYASFAPVIIDRYEETEGQQLFKKKDHFYKLSILYMICHVLYRSRKFEMGLTYLTKFRKEIEAHKRSHYNLFYPKYILIYAAVKSYMGQNEDSITTLEEAHPLVAKHSMTDALNINLNLAVYQFQQENYSGALRTLIQFEHNDSWYAKRMGTEWVMRKSLIELLTHFEKGNTDLALTKIQTFKKNYKKALQLPIYSRIKTFLGFIQDCIDKPYWVATQEYFQHVDNTLERWPVESEDLQAMAFYCWLKSKMLKKPYYHVLVETVNGRM